MGFPLFKVKLVNGWANIKEFPFRAFCNGRLSSASTAVDSIYLEVSYLYNGRIVVGWSGTLKIFNSTTQIIKLFFSEYRKNTNTLDQSVLGECSHLLRRPHSHRVTTSISRDSEETVIQFRFVWVMLRGSISIAYDRVLKNQKGTTLTQCMSALSYHVVMARLQMASPCSFYRSILMYDDGCQLLQELPKILFMFHWAQNAFSQEIIRF